jgi:hypothetical protein
MQQTLKAPKSAKPVETTLRLKRPNKQTTEWSGTDFQTKFIARTINPNPEYQRPETNELVYGGTGSPWQRKLCKDVLLLNPFQKIHLREVKIGKILVYEIIDGGHRSRAIMGFFTDCVRLPENTILPSENGRDYDVSGMCWSEVLTHYPELSDILNLIKFDLTIHKNITDKEAEELFLTLNDLHDMSAADKRNAIRAIITIFCRNLGAVDSKNAFKMFKEKEIGKDGKQKLARCGLALVRRETDEIVSMCVQYMWEGGIFSKYCRGLDSQTPLNELYRDTDFDCFLSTDEGVELLENVKNVLTHVDSIIGLGKLECFRDKWKKNMIKKVMCLIYEMSLAKTKKGIKFKNINIDYPTFHKKLVESIRKYSSNKSLIHHPHQRYEILNGKVCKVKDCNPNKGQMYKYSDVFTGGSRIDDLEFTLLPILADYTPEEWGINISNRSEDVRDFSLEQKNELWVEQTDNGVCTCKKCGTDLSKTEYRADHIVPHKQNGPTILENGQLLCLDCNEQKSSGMDVDDVEYVCEKVGYKKTDALLSMIDSSTLTADEIRLVSKKLFNKL